MKIYLYGKSFDITEANICEGRGKYLVRNSIKNADKLLKTECEKCNSVSEMTQKIPKITGELIVKVTQHMLYILRQEGISTNARRYINSVFDVTDSACQKACQELNSHTGDLNNEISYKLTEAALLDLENLWIGYSVAHGYSAQNEFYTEQKLKHSISEIALLSVNKRVSPIEVCVQALHDAPYENSIYEMIEPYVGIDKSLNYYKRLFTNPFKTGTYKDMPSQQELKILEREILEKIYFMFTFPECKFNSYVYYNNNNNQKTLQKFRNAIFNFAPIKADETPLVCFDTTIMGNTEDGMLISTKGIYMHNSHEEPKFFHFNDIKALQFNAKYIFINGQKFFTSGMSAKDIERFCVVVHTICELITPLYETER